MAHPFKGQADSSEKKRLGRLGAKAGKAFGSSSMYAKKKYPSKGAGTQREFTIPGGKGKNRPDRLQRGGSVRRHHAPTTNIIISHAGGRGGGNAAPPRPPMPMPVPVNRPVPVPVRPPIGGPPVGAGAAPVGALPARPPLPVGGPPIGAGVPPVMPPVRPPGMKKGGAVKRANGGGAGTAYRGFPNSPTTSVDSAVSARKKGGAVYKRGGRVKGLAAGGAADGDQDRNSDGDGEPESMQLGGAFGTMPAARPPVQPQGGLGGILGNIPGRTPQGPIQGPPTLSGRPMIPAQPVTVPMPGTLASFRARPAPGTQVGYRKGGTVHSDVAEDKKLIKKMIKQEDKAEKRKSGGVVNPGTASKARGLVGSSYKQWGKGYQAGGIVRTPLTNATGGGAGGKGRLAKTRAAARVPEKTEA